MNIVLSIPSENSLVLRLYCVQNALFWHIYLVLSCIFNHYQCSYVSFFTIIYIALFTMQIVSKQLYIIKQGNSVPFSPGQTKPAVQF